MNQDHKKLYLATAQNLTLTPSAVSVIQTLLSSLDTDDTRNDPHRAPSGTEEHWVKYGTVALSRKDMQQILGGKELSDLHVDAFQNLVKTCFPHIHGLQSTLFQLKSPLQCQEPGAKCLQIIHTRQSHWAALQVSGSDVCLYDSAYSSTSTDALQVIAQLVRSKNRSIQIQVMNIAKQTGATDCALYAMAMITCLALDIDPVNIVLNQEELRPHLVKSFEKGAITAFPVIKHRRPAKRVNKLELCVVYCYCRLPDNGETMICCDKCEEWFHVQCITSVPTNALDGWLCNDCKPSKS